MAYDEDEPVFRAAPAVARRVTRQGSRYYQWRGEQFYSVTTILDALGKAQGMLYWAANGVARWVVDNFDILEKSFEPKADGTGPREDPEIVFNRLKKVPWDVRDRSGDIGTAVHAAIEAHILGKPMPPWPLIIKPRMDAFARFLTEYNPTFLASEINVYNTKEKYAGTCDGIMQLEFASSSLELEREPGPLTVMFDVKTAKGIYEEPALQMSAYRHSDVLLAAPDGSEHPMPKIDTCAVLHLPEDGSYSLIEVRADDQVFKAFLYVREVFRFKDGLAKKVVLPPIRLNKPKALDSERRDVTECKFFGESRSITVEELRGCGCSRCLQEIEQIEFRVAGEQDHTPDEGAESQASVETGAEPEAAPPDGGFGVESAGTEAPIPQANGGAATTEDSTVAAPLFEDQA